MPRSGPTIAQTALELITGSGPQDLDALVRHVVAAGRTRAKDPRRAVSAAIEADPDLVPAWDGRWCSLSAQLDGAIFSTQVTELERRDEIVLLRDNLELVRRLVRRPRAFATGGEVHLDLFGDFFDLPWLHGDDDPDDMRDLLGDALADDLLSLVHELGLPADADEEETLRDLLWETRGVQLLHGPAGWIPSLSARQLLGITVRDGVVGTVALDRRDVSGPHIGIVGARVARLARLVIGPDPSWFGPRVISLEELLELVATEAPELLRRPLPPFDEVVRRGGLEVWDGHVGHRGTDWGAVGLVPPLAPGEAWGFQPSSRTH